MFYAERNPCGENAMTEVAVDGKQRVVSAGALLRFRVRADRDSFVVRGLNRFPLTAAQAKRRHIVRGTLATGDWREIEYAPGEWEDTYGGHNPER